MKDVVLRQGVMHVGYSPDGNYTIPDGFTCIVSNCFLGRQDIKSITLPSSLRIIGNGAFSCCENLKEIEFPPSIQVIEGEAFSGNRFTEVGIPGSVRNISYWSFSGSPTLEKVVLGDGVESIGIQAFAKCPNLSEMRIPASVHYIAENAFESCPHLTIFAPADSYAANFARQHDIPTTER